MKPLLLLLLKPFTWIIILVLAGYRIKNQRAKNFLFILAACVFLLFSNDYLANQAIKAYEGHGYTVSSNDTNSYTVGVVLGGYAKFNEEENIIQFTESSDRLWQAILLYKRGKIKKMMLSGGNIDTIARPNKEADFVAGYLRDIGIPKDDIIIENLSKSTKENALLTAKWLRKNNIKGPVLIITSAWHIPRTKKLFNKFAAGYNFDYFASDWRHSDNNDFVSNFFPSIRALQTWEILIKEIVGSYLA